MRKIFTFLFLLMALFCSAQINVVEKPRREVVVAVGCNDNNYVYHIGDNYYLKIAADDYRLRGCLDKEIKIGNNREEAIESIRNIERAYESSKDGDRFIIGGKEWVVDKGIIFGKLYYTDKYNEDRYRSIWYMRSYFGKLRLYTVSIEKYKEGKF